MSTLNKTQSEKIRRSAERPIVPDERVLSASICSNCVNRTGCIILARATVPIHSCELHECLSLSNADTGSEKKGVPEPEAASHDLSLLGLCANCLNRRQCTLSRPQSGVWHCEEYA